VVILGKKEAKRWARKLVLGFRGGVGGKEERDGKDEPFEEGERKVQAGKKSAA